MNKKIIIVLILVVGFLLGTPPLSMGVETSVKTFVYDYRNTLYTEGNELGDYKVEVKEKDVFNLNEWSVPIQISAPKLKIEDTFLYLDRGKLVRI